jgi:hypothetical protein
MHIEHTHKDGHQQTAVMKIFILIHLLDADNFSISRSYHNLLGFTLEKSDRTTEEVQQKQPYHYRNRSYHIEWPFGIDIIVKG